MVHRLGRSQPDEGLGPRGRGTQVTRQLRLLQLIDSRRRGIRVEEIVALLGVRRRTVYRDLEQLQAAGFPLVSLAEAGERRWQLSEGYRARVSAPAGILEEMALRAALHALQPIRGSQLHAAATAVAARNADAKETTPLLQFPMRLSAAVRPELVDRLVKALLEHEELTLEHVNDAGARLESRVEPLRLFILGGQVELAALEADSVEVRAFPLPLIEGVRATGRTVRPRVFDLDAWLLGLAEHEPQRRVELRLRSRLAARTISQRLGLEGVRVTTVGDELRFDAIVTRALRARLLAFGAHVEVVGPRALRQAIVSDLLAAAQLYLG